jgi:hypothetical protein
MISKEKWDRIVEEASYELNNGEIPDGVTYEDTLFLKLQEAENDQAINLGLAVKKTEYAGVLVSPSELKTLKYFVSGFVNSDELNTSAPFGTVIGEVPLTLTGEELIKFLCKEAKNKCDKLLEEFLASSVTLTYYNKL